jgi:hypothetical protein
VILPSPQPEKEPPPVNDDGPRKSAMRKRQPSVFGPPLTYTTNQQRPNSIRQSVTVRDLETVQR